MPYDTISPDKAGIVFFDMLNAGFRDKPPDDQRRLDAVVANCVRLRETARRHRVPLFFPKADHRPDGMDAPNTYLDEAPGGGPRPDPEKERFRVRTANIAGAWGGDVIDDLAPSSEDYVVPKHRWNAFHQTKLELSLRSRGIDTIVLCGAAIEIGIASTAYGARDLDFNLVVVRDACTSARQQVQDLYIEMVFPRMARVRTTDEVIRMLDAGAR
jgi:nicotinamidase-related amidase